MTEIKFFQTVKTFKSIATQNDVTVRINLLKILIRSKELRVQTFN